MFQDPAFAQGDRYYLTREESFDRAVEMNAQYMKLKKKYGIRDEEQAGELQESVIGILLVNLHAMFIDDHKQSHQSATPMSGS